MADFKLYEPFPHSVALVTGAGGGIGSCFAMQLAKIGYDVVLVGECRESLDRVGRWISRDFPKRRWWSVELDLAHHMSAEKLFAWCSDNSLKPYVVVNNAGVFSLCDMLNMDLDRVERVLNLHCVTITKCCRLFAEQMLGMGGGYILNLSSALQGVTLPGLSLYGASKAYIDRFTVTFSKEVKPQGVVVTLASPVAIATSYYGLSRRLQHKGSDYWLLTTPERCARRALRALSRGRRSVTPDWWRGFITPLYRLLSPFVGGVVRDRMRKFHK